LLSHTRVARWRKRKQPQPFPEIVGPGDMVKKKNISADRGGAQTGSQGSDRKNGER